MDIEQALVKLEDLLYNWNISPEEWVLGPVWALRLQGYDIRKFIERIDTNVPVDKLPWKPEEPLRDSGPGIPSNLREIYEFAKRRISIPSGDSQEIEDYIGFMNTTGYALWIHPLEANFFPESKVEYRLPNDTSIFLMTILDAVSVIAALFPIMRNRGEERWIQDHLQYIQEVRDSAKSKGDIEIANTCKKVLAQYA